MRVQDILEEDLESLRIALLERARLLSGEGRAEEAREAMRLAKEVGEVMDKYRAERAREIFELALTTFLGIRDDSFLARKRARDVEELSDEERELYAALVNLLGEFMSYE